jgi:hypothetical protein
MKQHSTLQACLLTLTLIGATTAQAATMTRAEHGAAEERIEATYKTERNACNLLKANGKDVCEQQAKAKEKVAKAELQASYSGKASDKDKVRMVKADTNYDVAKEMCDDKAGNDKDVCIKEAKAVQAKSRADTKLTETVRGAITDDAQVKLDADYQVAAEKCDALSGDAKSSCIGQAKTKYGKN